MAQSLASRLLFCLYSLLFGAVVSLLGALLRSVFSALRFLPCAESSPSRIDALFRIKRDAKHQKKKKSPRFFLGYLFYDTLCGVGFFSLYMLFLYACNGGVFRLYSLLLALCTLFLLRAPFARVLRVPTALFAALLRFFPWCVYAFFKRIGGKGRKKLDEKTNMV